MGIYSVFENFNNFGRQWAYIIVSGKVNQIWMQNVTFSVILVVFCSFCDDRSPSSEGVGRSDLEVLQILDDI